MAGRTIQAEELNVQAVETIEAEVVENTTETDEVQNDVFAQFMSDDSSEDKTKEDIIKELLASGNAKRINNLTVRNVVATQFDTHALLTFVVKEFVIGDTRSNDDVDAFGQPIVKLGKSHNIQSSSYAVASVMKDTPKLAIFATDVVNKPELANTLFAGSKIDVIMQYVPQGEEYKNPFSANAEPTTFDRDKMIHHIVRLELGEVGRDLYNANLLR